MIRFILLYIKKIDATPKKVLWHRGRVMLSLKKRWRSINPLMAGPVAYIRYKKILALGVLFIASRG